MNWAPSPFHRRLRAELESPSSVIVDPLPKSQLPTLPRVDRIAYWQIRYVSRVALTLSQSVLRSVTLGTMEFGVVRCFSAAAGSGEVVPCEGRSSMYQQPQGFQIAWHAPVSAVVLILAVTFAIPGAEAQTFTVLHNFTSGGDGASPRAGLTMDAAGNFYGTAYFGGTAGAGCGLGCGVAFRLRHSGSSWVLTPIYSFTGGNDGANPYGRLAIAQDGTLYGTTYLGGGTSSCMGYGCGTVFHLAPSPTAPRTALAPWKESVLFRFTGVYNGANPQGDVIFDRSGNIYGAPRQPEVIRTTASSSS